MSSILSFEGQASFVIADKPMIGVQLRPGIKETGDRVRCYRVAEHNLVADLSLADLFGFERNCLKQEHHAAPDMARYSAGGLTKLYCGPGWIGNQWREVSSWSAAGGYRIAISGIGTFWISEDGDAIICTEEESAASVSQVIEAALGPALILALALHGVWCLHASAVAASGRIIAFLGESGKGKSTLARWLDVQEVQNWRRVCDDILPLSLESGRLEVLPHFPQLKLPAGKQPVIDWPERLPLDAIYVLKRPVEGEEIAIRPLNSQQGALALVRHTVASRLYDESLMTKHLDFCIQAGSQIAVRELIYPLDPGAMQEVQQALMDDLSPQRNPDAVLAYQIQ